MSEGGRERERERRGERESLCVSERERMSLRLAKLSVPEIHLLADLAVCCQNPEDLSTGLKAPAPKIAEITATPTHTVRCRADKSSAGTRR